MRKCFLAAFAALLLGALILSGCGDSGGDPDYSVTTSVTGQGAISATPTKGRSGTSVTLYVEASPGNKYTADSLVVTGKSGNAVTLAGAFPNFSFDLIEDVSASAAFEVLAAGEYSINIDKNITGGKITASRGYAGEGEHIYLTISPAAGNVRVEGSLQYLMDNSTEPLRIVDNHFSMPQANVTISAAFEQGDSVALIEEGNKALAEGNLDAAIADLEAAYSSNPEDPSAIIYSSLGKLASIAVDPKVRQLFRERVGIRNYPGTINGLIMPNWMEVYTNEELKYGVYSNGDYLSWHDAGDDWFFDDYGLTPISGYYKYTGTGETRVEALKQNGTLLPRQNGRLEWYHDDALRADPYWYDADEIPYYVTTGPGYYYYDWELTGQLKLVPGTQKTGDLDSYTDPATGINYEWEEENYWGGNSGFEGPGYYRRTFPGNYQLISQTPQYETFESRLPGLDSVAWMEESNAYQDSLSDINGLQSDQTFGMLLFANLLDKNQSGLNALLDDLISGVFGTTFEEAYDRMAALNDTDKVTLSQAMLAAYGIDEIYSGDEIYIGKAELSLLFSALRFVKGGLEWVASYNWDTDLSWLAKSDVWGMDAESVLTEPRNLPFENNFLKARNGGQGGMTKSKASFDTAITDAIKAYDLLMLEGSQLPQGARDSLDKYRWGKDAALKLQAAIKNGGVFYFKMMEGNPSTYDNSEAGALLGLDMGKFFSPGQFALDSLIETENDDGRKPVIYGRSRSNWDSNETWRLVTSKEEIALTDTSDSQNRNFQSCGFKLNRDVIEEVIIYSNDENFNNALQNGETFVTIPVETAGYLWDWYNN